MSSENFPRAFKGIWIPRELWCDNRLTSTEKCMVAEIDSLDGENGCYASNEYFCKFFNTNVKDIQRMLKKLHSLGFITYLETSKRTLKSNLNKVYTTNLTLDNDKFDPLPTRESPMRENIVDNIVKKDPPLPPPKKTELPKEQIKKDLKKKISFEEKEFEEAYQSMLTTTSKVNSPVGWLKKTIENSRLTPQQESTQDRTDRHRKQSEEKQRVLGILKIEVAYNRVIINPNGSPTNYKEVRFDVSEKEWQQKTGWKNEV